MSLVPGVRVYTHPDVHVIPGAGWEHPSLTCWGDAVAAWDRDYPYLTVSTIHVCNAETRPSLWVGVDEVDVLYGRRSGVVRWHRDLRRWELVGSHRDSYITRERAYWFAYERGVYERRMAPTWRKLGIEGW